MSYLKLEANPDFIWVKLDLKNAFNQIARAAIVENLLSTPVLQHVAWFEASVLAPESGLQVKGALWGTAAEGETQGDPKASFMFNVGIQPQLRLLDTTLAQAGGMARSGMDDVVAGGPAHILFPALRTFEQQLQEHCNLQLVRTKTEVFCGDDDLPEETPAGMVRAGDMVDGQFEAGFVFYGIPMGSDKYVEYKLINKVEEITRGAERACKILAGERQSLWTVLRSSLSQQFDYWCSLCYPSNVQAVAEQLDNILWRVLENAAGFAVPRGEGDRGADHVLEVPVVGLNRRTFQEWVVRLPVRMGGMGLRSLSDMCLTSFIGAVEQTLPSFPGEGGLCPELSRVFGGLECFGPNAPVESRWRVLLQSGCRTGRELSGAWTRLQTEAIECCNLLGDVLEGALAMGVEGIGDGSVSGATRRLIVEQRETLRARVLDKSLSVHHDQAARPVWVWQQRDKLSGQWLLSLPGLGSGLVSLVFTESLASYLCLPSPACLQRLRERVGRTTVDPLGRRVITAALPGDSWRKA